MTFQNKTYKVGNRSFVGQAAVAEYLGVSVTTVANYLRTHGNLDVLRPRKHGRLVAPEHIRGRPSRRNNAEIYDARDAWAAARGSEGWSTKAVGLSLGINITCARKAMLRGGWDAWALLRNKS